MTVYTEQKQLIKTARITGVWYLQKTVKGNH